MNNIRTLAGTAALILAAAGTAQASMITLNNYTGNGTYTYALAVPAHSGTGIALQGHIKLTGLAGVTGVTPLIPQVIPSHTSDSVTVYAPYGYQFSNTTPNTVLFNIFRLTSTVLDPGVVAYIHQAGYTTFEGTIAGPAGSSSAAATPEAGTIALAGAGLLGLVVVRLKRQRRG